MTTAKRPIDELIEG